MKKNVKKENSIEVMTIVICKNLTNIQNLNLDTSKIHK